MHVRVRVCVCVSMHVCVRVSVRVLVRVFLCHSVLLLLSLYLPFIPVVFETLTEKHLTELFNVLKYKLEILAMISLSWFLTLFLSVMDSTVAVNIIDCFFIDGAKVNTYNFQHQCCILLT